ncbi:hypothetical protein [Rhodobaculum claviforme]|uniref:Uncharacterized protein n=1 Tax=Rhodobaculum claviforme TaxID=1549854 RepID=A0A934TLC8_9RHOB|nr:hypothetical protein [Rhodobaculum claviforme]MBK5928264.1 hypothetical protein [Rhodobaculum claviforme]
MAIAAERPWHLVPVGIIALLWHAGGALDYLLTKIGYAPYLEQVPAEWLVYFDAMPAWVTGAWAVGVWGGLLGAVLLLMREHWAPLALAASFFAVGAATIWLTLLSDPPMQQAVGMEFTWVMILATGAAFLLWIYGRAMRRRGVIT